MTNSRRPVPATERCAALAAAYQATGYRVLAPATTIEVRVGVPSPALDALGGGQSWAMISADNPGSVRSAEAENVARRAALHAALGAAGCDYLAGENVDPDGQWPVEVACWVRGLSRRQACALAECYGQWAFLWAAPARPVELVWTPQGAQALESGP